MSGQDQATWGMYGKGDGATLPLRGGGRPRRERGAAEGQPRGLLLRRLPSAFAHQLGRADMPTRKAAPTSSRSARGAHHSERDSSTSGDCGSPSPKGLFRFHTTCCNTPIGNTLSPRSLCRHRRPGVLTIIPKTVDGVFGPPIGAILGKYAIGKPLGDSTGINLRSLLRATCKVLGWRLRGRAWPNPLLQPKTREPVFPLKVLAQEQREALRPLCGRSRPEFSAVVPAKRSASRDP